MRKIEKPQEYEVCKISEWGEATGVYTGGFSDHEKVDLKWHTANDRDYLTLSEIAEKVDATLITVFVDTPFEGKILQYGNYGNDWWEIGKTEGESEMMNTGICRKIDDLGRVSIPKRIRRNLNITEGEELEIWVENGNTICFKPVREKDDDFVSWEWLKQYANGKRFNFASDFVIEAENKYRENNNG